MKKKTIRLNKVLRELNISLDTAIDFLYMLGDNVEARPTTQINEKQYEFLRYKFNKKAIEQDSQSIVENLITSTNIISKIRNKKGVPKSIYKYYGLSDYNFDSLVNQYLYYPKPSDFNDPFDCSPELISFINENSKQKTRHKKKEKIFAEKLKNVGICCFSRTKDSTLMWSHYANSHKGFCVEYKTNQEIDDINPLDVNYIPNFKKANYFDKAKDSIFHLIYSKSIEWNYEEELRSLKTNLNQDSERKVSFKKTDILAIYFGVKAEQKTIEKTLEYI